MMEMTNTLNNGMCRCCSSEGTFKDIKTKYHWMGEEEVYADMLTDCFDIKISTPEDMDNGICEVCITQLRNAANFKKQVLHTEAQFKRRLQNKEIKNPIKLESMDEDPIESDHLSDPDFSSNEYEVPIKEELEDKPKAKKRAAKATTSRAKKPKAESEPAKKHELRVQSVIKRETSPSASRASEERNGRNTGTATEETRSDTTSVKKKELSLSSKPKYIVVIPRLASNTTLTLKKLSELELHLDNLKTIMRCSNATPLKIQGIWFKCCFCTSRYEDHAALKTHTLESHVDGKALASRSSIAKLILRMDITGLQCKLCESYVSDLEVLTKHLQDEHSEKIHTLIKSYMIPFKFDSKEPRCAICGAEFSNFKVLLVHMNSHFGNFVCKICGSGFVNQGSLNIHTSRHANGLFKCETCQRIFDNNLKLKDHKKAVHQGMNKRHKCDFCDEKFVGVIAKSIHMTKEHNMPVPVATCTACDKTFKNRQHLAIHMRAYHMMEKQHKCTECDKMFFSKYDVKMHMLTHSGQRDFKCIVCGKAYGRKSTLREHMRIHADDRRFKCEHCGMTFVQKCSWKAHLRSKHGEEV